MAYVKDAAGHRKVTVLTSVEKKLLQDLDLLLKQKDWHPCQIGTAVKKILMTNNSQVVRRMRRKYYRKLTEKCNLHDRHSGVGVGSAHRCLWKCKAAGDAEETPNRKQSRNQRNLRSAV